MYKFILGSGYSVRQGMWSYPATSLSLWEALRHEFTISLNWGYKFCQPDISMYADYKWYENERQELKKLPIVIGPNDDHYYRKGNKTIEKNTYLYKGWHQYIQNDWNKVYVPQLAGIPAITLAVLLGCKEIYLLGYDAGCDEQGRTHFYQDIEGLGTITWKGKDECGIGKDYRGFFNTDNYNKPKEMNEFWFKPFEQEAQRGVKIYNVSPNSTIENFPKIDYQEFYKRLGGSINKEELYKELKQIFGEKLI